MTAVARGLSEHPLPDLVMAGNAGDLHVIQARPRTAVSQAATQLQDVAALNGVGSRKPETPPRGIPWWS